MRTKDFIIIVCFAVVGSLPAISYSSQGYVADFSAAYPKSEASLRSCSLCHTAAPALNNYGSDFAAYRKSTAQETFVAIQSLDSDGDTFENLTEINAGSLPGDFDSTPVASSDAATGTITINLGNGVSITIPDCAAGGGITINNNTNGSPSTPGLPSTPGNPFSCTSCHSDGRSGTLPVNHPAIGGTSGTPSQVYSAALCITCHRDGRSGALSSGHEDISNLANILASSPGRSATDNSAICNTCHSGRSGTIPGDHPNLSGNLSGRGDGDEEEDD